MSETQVVALPLERVRPDPEQHRQVFPEEYIAGLADSIKAQGQITPVKVRPDPQSGPGQYVVIDGECRLRACVYGGLPTVRAEVCEGLSEYEVVSIQGAANLSRRDVEPCAAGRALRKSIDALRVEKPWLSEDEARKVVQESYGVSGQFAVARLKLLHLPEDVQALVDKGSVGIEAALALLPLVEKGETAQAVRFALSVQSGKLRPSDVSHAMSEYLGEQAQGSLFGADEGKATKEQRATRDALTRAVWNWGRGTSLVFGAEKQEGFDLETLGAEELAIHEVKVEGLLRTLRGVLADVQAAQGKVPDLAPERPATSVVSRPVQAAQQASTSFVGLGAEGYSAGRRELGGGIVARVSGPDSWLWLHGIGQEGTLAEVCKGGGGLWTDTRGGAWFIPDAEKGRQVLRLIESYLRRSGQAQEDLSEPVERAALEAAG